MYLSNKKYLRTNFRQYKHLIIKEFSKYKNIENNKLRFNNKKNG